MLDPDSKVNANKDEIVTSVKHSKKKQNLLLKFFDILSKSNILAELSTLVPLDKDVPDVTTRRFFVVLSGVKSQKKEKIIDEAMSHFCENHRRKSVHPKAKSNAPTEYDFDYQPSSFATDLKTLFGVFKSHGVAYCINDFEKDGTFLSNLYGRWKKVAEVREDFGALPMQATFDISMDAKLRSALEKKVLDIDNNYKHFVMLILQLVGKTSMLRGGTEVSVSLFFICFLFFKLTSLFYLYDSTLL